MITSRSYSDDYENIVRFLEEAYKENNNQDCWLPQKWEYTEYLVDKLHRERDNTPCWHNNIRIWEENNAIIAVAHTESDDSIFIEIKKGYENLYPKILDWCEENISNDCQVSVFTLESMKYREEELKRRGYKKEIEISEDKDKGQYQNCQCLNSKTYETTLPYGFEIVCHYDVKDDYVRQYAVHKGFHPNDEFPAPDAYVIPFLSMEKAPMFDGNLELMIKDISENKYVGMVVFWYNKETNTAMLEPMSIHPEYHGKGLGYGLIMEGLRRLKKMGVNKVYVESFNSNRKAFYNK